MAPQRGAHERAQGVVLGGERGVAHDEARTRQRHDVVDAQDGHLVPWSATWTGSLLANPVAASTWSVSTADALAEVREQRDGQVVRRQARGAEQRLEHHPAAAVLAGRAQGAAREVGRARDADDALANTTDGNFA